MFKKSLLTFLILSAFCGKAISNPSINLEQMPHKNGLYHSCIMGAPQATTEVKLNGVNLSMNDQQPLGPFSSYNPATYNFVSTGLIYDSLGISHILELYFVRSEQWDYPWKVFPVINGYVLSSSGGQIKFTPNGTFDYAWGLDNLLWFPPSGAEPLSINIDASCVTNFAMQDIPGIIESNGHAAQSDFHKKLFSNPSHLKKSAYCLAKAKATTEVKLHLNLGAADLNTFGPLDPKKAYTYNFTSKVTIYDSLGAPYNLTLYLKKTEISNNWQAGVYFYDHFLGLGELKFNSQGLLSEISGLDKLSLPVYSGAATPQIFSINMTCTTQYGNADNPAVEEPWQNGFGGSYAGKIKL